MSDELFSVPMAQTEAIPEPPSVRLAWSTAPAAKASLSPAVRLAWFDIPAVDAALSPTVRLAHKSAQGDGTLTGRCGTNIVPKIPPQHSPALLVSYYYVEPFLKNRTEYQYRDWIMDSGAFSAHNSGAKIDLNRYIDKCLELFANDMTLTEVFALDVIPADPNPATVAKAMEQSIKNTEEMWRQGVPAIPCYHAGEPEEALMHIAKNYPKIALGGVAGNITAADHKWNFFEQCFARIWPKRVHGFGISTDKLVHGLPFHSVDATNWEIGPCAFGNWQKFGAMSVRGSKQDLRSQVKFYLDMEAKARVRWKNEMAVLDAMDVNPECRWYDKVQVALKVRTQKPRDKSNDPVVPEKAKRKAKAEKPATAGEPATPVVAAEPVLPKGELDDKWKKNWWM